MDTPLFSVTNGTVDVCEPSWVGFVMVLLLADYFFNEWGRDEDLGSEGSPSAENSITTGRAVRRHSSRLSPSRLLRSPFKSPGMRKSAPPSTKSRRRLARPNRARPPADGEAS